MDTHDAQVPVVNDTMSLADCRHRWTFNEKYDCWCLEDVLYTPRASVPQFQRLSIFVPRAYLDAEGQVNPTGQANGWTARTAPVVFDNNAAGYMQMPHTWLDGPRCNAPQYLAHGLVYVTCGCRGRESRDAQGRLAGKSPATLVDFKTALRFLRHNRDALPGDWGRVISTGWSAGGAMSTLLGVTGDHPRYDAYLRENGAFMDESDAVFAAQIYCPIVDLEHADLAYEWMFRADRTCEDSPAGPAETMSSFKAALSQRLFDRYVAYVNGLGLRHPATGEALTLGPDGRSGPFYDYLMARLDDAATDYLARLEAHALPQHWTAADYLSGNYCYEAPAPKPHDPGQHHAGPGVSLREADGSHSLSLGERLSRPRNGQPFREMAMPMETRQGTDKRDWLRWDGHRAAVSDLDAYVLRHRGRMKPCTSFDTLGMNSGENQVFGSPEQDYAHFSPAIGQEIAALASAFPAESARFGASYADPAHAAAAERVYLLNPMNFITATPQGRQAHHFRIRVGARDADTSLTIAMTLALRLANVGLPVDYALVWDQPHTQADYPGDLLAWIDRICR